MKKNNRKAVASAGDVQPHAVAVNAIVAEVEIQLSRYCPCRQRRPGGNEHVLAAIEHVGDRRCPVEIRSHLIAPEQLAVARIERQEVPLVVAAEDEIRGGRQQTGRRRREIFEFPAAIASGRIDRTQRSVYRHVWTLDSLSTTGRKPLPLD